MLLLMIERGMPIDIVLTADTGMEFPEMYDHLAKLDEYLYRERGIHLTMLRHPKGFEYMMFEEEKQRYLLSRIVKSWGFRFTATAGPVSESGGVPGSSKHTLLPKRSTDLRVSIVLSIMWALLRMNRSESRTSNIRWWIGVLPRRRL